jgi:pyruvate dehydrogenase E1 component beta subunit
VGAAAGAAASGLRPVAELMFVDFIGVALDQLFNQAVKMRYMFGGKAKVPMTLRMPQGAGIGAAAQHSQSLESWFMNIPGLKVVIPSTPYDAKGLLISAIRDDNPVVFLEHKLLYGMTGEVPDESYTIEIGKADIKREGSDVTIVATSQMVYSALEAAERLKADGIEAEVVDPRCLQPLDKETILESVKKTHALVVANEAVSFAGPGAEIVALAAEEALEYLDAPVKRVGAPFCPVPFSPPLEQAYIPNADDIVAAVKSIR